MTTTVTRASIALLSCSVLCYQIAITRLLSVVFWYHFAFLSISLAMLGLGASGVWLCVRPASESAFTRMLWTAALGLPLSVIVIVQGSPAVHALGLGQGGFLALAALAMLVPLYALGAAICWLLTAASGRALASLYAADLLGATAGALLVVPALSVCPTPQLLAGLGLLPLMAASARAPRKALVGAALILTLIVWGAPLRVRYGKLYAEQGEATPLHEVWTPGARITVLQRPIFSPEPDVPWGWGYGDNYEPSVLEERWIDQDGSAGTPVERLQGEPAALTHLQYDVTSFGYQLLGPRNVCIIGAGGGRDLVTALGAGARTVDAVELNAGIVSLMTGPLAAFSGDVYRRPGVNAVVSEGRSYLTRTSRRYDLIQISMVDSWAATAAGAYALSESYLYTVEALDLYLNRLEPGGALSISRWSDRVQPFEAARLILMAARSLQLRGVAHPQEHMLLWVGSNIATLLVKNEPWSPELRAQAERIAQLRGFTRAWPPRAEETPSLAALAMSDGGAALTRAGLDLAPPHDDRPFFFQAQPVFQWSSELVRAAASDINLQSVELLRQTLLLLAVLALVLFFAPLALFSRPARADGLWRGSGYFFCIGLGFMLLEVPWIGVSVLFIGQPSAAAAVVLSALLLGAGIGSFLSGKLTLLQLRRGFVALPLMAAVVSVLVGPAFRAGLALPMAARVALAVGLFGSAGLTLGVALPFGLRWFSEPEARARKAWLWALNGAAGVLASALAIALAMTWGFRNTMFIGAGCYALALACVLGPGGRERSTSA